MAQRKGSLGWTKFDGDTYTPLGLRIFPRKQTARNIAVCLKEKEKIDGYRILEASRPFKNSPRGYIVYVKGKFGHMGHLNKDVEACRRRK